MGSSSKPAVRTWTRDGYLISTDPNLVPLSALSAAFDSPLVYWAKSIPEPSLRAMLDNSLPFGLYSPTSILPPTGTDPEDSLISGGPESAAETLHEIAGHVKPSTSNLPRPAAPIREPSSDPPALIGFARLITDTVTFAYLTDVYVLPQWQGQKLGKWLIECVQEVVESMPHLRRIMALIGGGEWDKEQWYEKMMNMKRVPEGPDRPYIVIEMKRPGRF